LCFSYYFHFNFLSKFFHTINKIKFTSDIPPTPHWAVIVDQKEKFDIPGDERSRSNTGHGYPARTETVEYLSYYAFSLSEKDEIVFNEKNDLTLLLSPVFCQEKNISEFKNGMNAFVRAFIVQSFEPRFFYVCPECGNKRCPKATDHDFECTDSNDTMQPGSVYSNYNFKTEYDF
jgi:hypothetical protein